MLDRESKGRGRAALRVTTFVGVAPLMMALAGSAFAAPDGAQPEHKLQKEFVFDGAPLSDGSIYLRAGRLDTTQLGVDRVNEVLSAPAPQNRMLIHLNAPLSRELEQRLEMAGIQVIDYLPSNAIIARVNANAGGIDAIRWVGAFEPEWKIDPEVGNRTFQNPDRKALDMQGRVALHVSLFADAQADASVDRLSELAGVIVHARALVGRNVTLSVEAPAGAIESISRLSDVQYIEEAPDITLRNSTNRWIVQSNIAGNFPLYNAGLHGEGQIVGVIDGRPDTNHCSLNGGKVLALNGGGSANSHGTHVSATAVGDDGIDNDTRGVAYMANMVWAPIPAFNEAAITTALNTHHGQGARIHTNSWGDDGTTAYNSLARGFDSFLYANEDSFVALAVTNTSALRNPENAKNLLACGASQDTPNQGSFCSGGSGPTSDGRRKPEVYAPGCGTISASVNTTCSTTSLTGTSMATPAIAGAAALIRQYYSEGFYPGGVAAPGDAFTPSGALIKATVINSAVDMTNIAGYPSNQEGWGRILANNALYFDGETRALFVEDVRNANGIFTNDELVIPIDVIGSAEQLRITLVWMDPPATAGAATAWVNDLDLEVESPNAELFKGNVFSGGVSIVGGAKDDRNNVEQVHVSTPVTGVWAVKIKGASIPVGPQGFALVVTGEIVPDPSSLSIRLAAPIPTLVLPGAAPTVDVIISPGDDSIVPDSAMFHYRADGGAFVSEPLSNVGGDLWRAQLPPVLCEDTPEFFFSVEGVSTGVVALPSLGIGSPLSFDIGEIVVSLNENFETDPGWTVSGNAIDGQWERGVPVANGRGDPPADADGSGQCWLTDNGLDAGDNSDVDGGSTILTSTPYSVAPGDTLSYAYWIDSGPGVISSDSLTVAYSTTVPPASWTIVRTYTSASPTWRIEDLVVGSDIPASATLSLQFTASDLGTASLIECGIDQLVISRFVCENPPVSCEGDADGNDMVDVNDISYVVFRLGQAGPDGDVDGTGTVDVNDISYVVFRLGQCIPK